MPLAHPLWCGRPMRMAASANLTDFMREANERFDAGARLRGALALVGRFRRPVLAGDLVVLRRDRRDARLYGARGGERMPGSRWFRKRGSTLRRTCCGARMTRPP